MNKKQPQMMRSLSDMPKMVLILEAIGMLILVFVFLAMNDYVSLPAFLMSQSAFVSLVMVGVGCLMPAAVNIVWRAIHSLSFIGIDNKKSTEERNKSSKKRP